MRVHLLCALVALAGCTAPVTDDTDDLPAASVEALANATAAAHADHAVVAEAPMVRFETDHGVIDLLVYDAWMPATAGHFLDLVDAGFYDNTQIHRVIPGFVIQGGDPTGTGTGGSGTTVVHEFDARLQYLSGGLGLARDSDPDSGDSQWFITTDPALRMSDPEGEYAQNYGTYAMFGQVVRGQDVVRTISQQVTVPEQDRPVLPVLVQSAQRIDNDIDAAAYPLRPVVVGDATLSMPLHVYAGHPATITLESATGDAHVEIDCGGDSHHIRGAGSVAPSLAEGLHTCMFRGDGDEVVIDIAAVPWP